MGYGPTQRGGSGNRTQFLRKAQRNLADRNKCKEKEVAGVLCSTSRNTSTCGGDSGGPVIVEVYF